MNRRYYSSKEIATLLGISEKTLENHRGQATGLPYYRIGDGRGLIVYDLEEVMAIVKASRVEPEPAAKLKLVTGGAA